MTTVEPRTEIPRQPGGTRSGPTVRARVFRPRRMVPATIAAAVIFVAAALGAAAIVAGLIGREIAILHVGAIASWLARTPWNSPVIEAIGGAAALVGLLLIVTALVPGRPRAVALNTGRPDVRMGLTRAGLRCVAATAASDVDGVDRARAKARGRKVRVKVRTPLRDRTDAAQVGATVKTAVDQAMDRLDLARPVTTKVRVRRST